MSYQFSLLGTMQNTIFVRASCFLFLLLATFAFPLSVSAAISNGAAAIDMLGQYDDSLINPQPVYTKNGVNNGPNKLGFNQPYGSPVIDMQRHRLFIGDSANNRVLVFNLNNDHTLPDHNPDFVLGQPNFHSVIPRTSRAGLVPEGVASVGE